MLKFQVQGSGAKPYIITADGEGPDLRMFCTCPAGRKSAMFCKHQRAILLGEVTNLVEPSDDPVDLKSRVQGSRYLEAALAHVSVKERKPVVEGFSTLSEVLERYGEAMRSRGYRCELVDVDSPWVIRSLHCYGLGKHKKELKYPVASLTFEELTADHSFTPDGEAVLTNIRPRTRPWSVLGSKVEKPGTWSSLSRALPAFLGAVGVAG